MSSVAALLQSCASFNGAAPSYAHHIADEFVKASIVGGITGVLTTAFMAGLAWMTARYLMRRGQLATNIIHCETTHFARVPDAELRKRTTHERLYDQITVRHGSINIDDSFPSKLRSRMLRHLKRALEMCTDEEPVLYQHFIKFVTNERERASFRYLVGDMLKNSLNGDVGGGSPALRASLTEDQRPETIVKIPMLIGEYCPLLGKRMTLIAVDPAQLKRLPADGEVNVIGREPPARRAAIKGIKTFLEALPHDERKFFEARVPTGEIAELRAQPRPMPA